MAVVFPEPGGPSRKKKSGVASAPRTKVRCSCVPSRVASVSILHGGSGLVEHRPVLVREVGETARASRSGACAAAGSLRRRSIALIWRLSV